MHWLSAVGQLVHWVVITRHDRMNPIDPTQVDAKGLAVLQEGQEHVMALDMSKVISSKAESGCHAFWRCFPITSLAACCLYGISG